MLIDYKTYCENRIKDLEKLKSICVGMDAIDVAINATKESMKLIQWVDRISNTIEKHIGRELHPAEIDIYLQLLMGYVISQLTAEEQLDITNPEEMIPILSKHMDKILPGFHNKEVIKVSTSIAKELISLE